MQAADLGIHGTGGRAILKERSHLGFLSGATQGVILAGLGCGCYQASLTQTTLDRGSEGAVAPDVCVDPSPDSGFARHAPGGGDS